MKKIVAKCWQAWYSLGGQRNPPAQAGYHECLIRNQQLKKVKKVVDNQKKSMIQYRRGSHKELPRKGIIHMKRLYPTYPLEVEQILNAIHIEDFIEDGKVKLISPSKLNDTDKLDYIQSVISRNFEVSVEIILTNSGLSYYGYESLMIDYIWD